MGPSPAGFRRLIFRSCWVGPILDGLKVLTIRRRCRFVPGSSLVFCNGYRTSDRFAEAQLLENSELLLDDVDDRLARADGFSDAAELREGLAATYPGEESFRLLRFRLTRSVESHPLVRAHRRPTRT